MTDETRLTSEKPSNMDSKTLYEKLKYYFHYSTFKSELQENAIKTILKRKYLKIKIFIILTIHFLKENLMFSYQCQLVPENRCVINCRLFSIHLKLLLFSLLLLL